MAYSLLSDLKTGKRFVFHAFIILVICLLLFAIYRAIRYFVNIKRAKAKTSECKTKEGGYAKCDCK